MHPAPTRLYDSVGVGWGPRSGMSHSSQVTLTLLVWELTLRIMDLEKSIHGLLYKWFPEKGSDLDMVRKNNIIRGMKTRVLVPALS